MTHVIHWRNLENGRTGRGTKLMTAEEARALALELNRDYPKIEHTAVPVKDSHIPPLRYMHVLPQPNFYEP